MTPMQRAAAQFERMTERKRAQNRARYLRLHPGAKTRSSEPAEPTTRPCPARQGKRTNPAAPPRPTGRPDEGADDEIELQPWGEQALRLSGWR